MTKMNKLLKKIKMSLSYFHKYLFNKNFRKAFYYRKYYNSKIILKNHVFYESFHGTLFGGNPYAIFKFLYKNPEYKHLKHVIAVKNKNSPLLKKYKKNSDVIIVKSNSKKYIKYLKYCEYIINNVSFSPNFTKKKEQKYIYTWHSTLLKRLGAHGNRIWESRTINRSLIASDFFTSPNKYTTDLLLPAYYMDNVYSGLICEFGYPRNDLIKHSSRIEIRRELDLKDGEKMILYAPTWRGEITSPQNIVNTFINFFEEINAEIPSKYKMYIKLHNMVYEFIEEKHHKYLTPFSLDTNELLSVTDILITDYSGIMFDYLLTDNPIVLFTYDKKSYEKHQGQFYMELEKIPATLCYTSREVINTIRNIDKIHQRNGVKYEKFKNSFVYADDGNASKNISELVFKNIKKENTYKINIKKREKILLIPGKLNSDIEIDDFLKTVNNLDFNKFELTILFVYSHGNLESHLKINKNVKILYLTAHNGYSLKEYLLLNNFERKDMVKNIELLTETAKRCVRRVIGDYKFDYLVDFGVDKINSFNFALGIEYRKKILVLKNSKYSIMKANSILGYTYDYLIFEDDIGKQIKHKKDKKLLNTETRNLNELMEKIKEDK